jgi:hypothetical protein
VAPINILRAIFMFVQNEVWPYGINVTMSHLAPDLPICSDKRV